MNITFFGGDLRQVFAAIYLQTNNTADTVKIFGVDVPHLKAANSELVYTDDYKCSDVIIFPLPFSKDGRHINCPLTEKEYEVETISSSLGPSTKIFAGLINSYHRRLLEEFKLNVIDYYDFECLQIKNSVPTAEGALRVFYENSRKTLMGSNVTVTGYGKVAKALSTRLLALGAEVTVAARNESSLVEASCMGCKTETIEKYFSSPRITDCIFNTVPYNLFDIEYFKELPSKPLIIDLASKPYGVAPQAVELLGEKYVLAPSLPGRLFPETAGKIIGQTILTLL